MRSSVVDPHKLGTNGERYDVAVVVDVLRCCTTLAACIDIGSTQLTLVADAEAAMRLMAMREGTALVGEDGGRGALPFTVGNSPSRVLTSPELSGAPIMLLSSNGTPVVTAAQRVASDVYCGSFANVNAIADRLRTLQPDTRVALIPSSTWTSDDADEDLACCEYLATIMSGATTDVTPFLDRVRQSAAAQKFLTGNVDFPEADLDRCATDGWCEDPLLVRPDAIGMAVVPTS